MVVLVVVVVMMMILMLQNKCLFEAQGRHTAVIYGFFRHSHVYWLYLED
jgi:hypothetical protein